MEENTLIATVQATSLTLMNAKKGDGTIYACWDDHEIVKHFSGMSAREIVEEVARLDKQTKDHYDDIMGTAF